MYFQYRAPSALPETREILVLGNETKDCLWFGSLQVNYLDNVNNG